MVRVVGWCSEGLGSSPMYSFFFFHAEKMSSNSKGHEQHFLECFNGLMVTTLDFIKKAGGSNLEAVTSFCQMKVTSRIIRDWERNGLCVLFN